MRSTVRAFAILEAMADAGGVIRLSDLATRSGLPIGTIHRLVRSLVDLGYVRQDPTRQYSLGPRLLRLADHSATRLDTLAHPYLAQVVEALDETVNLALLDGEEIVYMAQVEPSHNLMRMLTQIGRRIAPHAAAVGKAILANRSDADVLDLLNRTGMEPHTPRTITSPSHFLTELELVRKRGYAIDDGEQELGVRCIAVAVHNTPRSMALSVSGPAPRITDRLIELAAPMLQWAGAQITSACHYRDERT